MAKKTCEELSEQLLLEKSLAICHSVMQEIEILCQGNFIIYHNAYFLQFLYSSFWCCFHNLKAFHLLWLYTEFFFEKGFLFFSYSATCIGR